MGTLCPKLCSNSMARGAIRTNHGRREGIRTWEFATFRNQSARSGMADFALGNRCSIPGELPDHGRVELAPDLAPNATRRFVISRDVGGAQSPGDHTNLYSLGENRRPRDGLARLSKPPPSATRPPLHR